jgi:hypothetical protein
MYKLIAAGLILLTIPAYAQEDCGDLNCNGWCFEIGDLVLGARIIALRCPSDYIEQCTVDNGDVDGDGIPITIADVMKILYIVNGSDFPDFSRHPESDTISIQSAYAAPGETLELPLFIKTVDTLTAFQFTIHFDSDFVTIDTVTFVDSMFKDFSTCDGYIYGIGFSEEVWDGDYYSYLPGEYHVANIVLTVNSDIAEPVTTNLEFLNDPEAIRNTGFANIPLIIPVTVDGEIQITPTGLDDGETGIVPRDISIEVYPNPFNGNANIVVRSDSRTELVIYDIMGRAVRRFPVEEGQNQFGWDATDDYGVNLGSGIYFAKVKGAPTHAAKKIVYLK